MSKWIEKTHSVPLFQKERSKGHIDVLAWKLGVKGLLKKITDPFAYRNVKYFVQFLSFPRSGHSLIGSLLDAHPNAVVSHELDVMGLIQKNLSGWSVYGLIKSNSETFTENGRYWNGFSYKVENQPHGASENLQVIGDKKGDWAVRWYGDNPRLIAKLNKTVASSPRWILVTRHPMDNIATLSLRKNRNYDKLRIKNKSGDLFTSELKENQEAGNISKFVCDDMISDYENLCSTISKMRKEISGEHILHVVYEDFCEDPKAGLTRICNFLDIIPHPDYLNNCSKKVRHSLNKSRHRIEWSKDQIRQVKDIALSYEFLQSYRKDIQLHE